MQTYLALILIPITGNANLSCVDPNLDQGECKLILRWSSSISRIMQTYPTLLLIQITEYANFSCFSPHSDHRVCKLLLLYSSSRSRSMQTYPTLLLIQITEYAILSWGDPHTDHRVCNLFTLVIIQILNMQPSPWSLPIHLDHAGRSQALILAQISEYAIFSFFDLHPNHGLCNLHWSSFYEIFNLFFIPVQWYISRIT